MAGGDLSGFVPVHAVVLVKFPYWSMPIGWGLAILMLGGNLAAILILSGQFGETN